MKKLIICFILMTCLLSVLVSQEIVPDTSNIENDGFTNFFKNNIGKYIVVIIDNIDLTIEGKLLGIYSDGVIIETRISLQQVYIPKKSIALAKTALEINEKFKK